MNLVWRVRLISAIFLLVFILIIARLFYWQVMKGEDLAAQADSQHFSSLEVPASRGEILFSDGSSLVANKNSYLLYANLKKLADNKDDIADKVATVLAPQIPFVSTSSAQVSVEERDNFLKVNKEELKKKIADRLSLQNAIWVNLAHFVSRSDKEKIAALNIAGLDFADEQTRDYPEASMAAHVIGFVGSDAAGTPKGFFGLEGFYERELSGKPGEVRVEKDALGRPIAIGEETRRDQQNGSTLVTTIDRSVQMFTETELLKGIADWQATGGTAIVADPKTGAIIAMANAPAYSPDNFSYYPTNLYKNPAVANLYEPGSIMKPLVMAAAINENKLTPETRCNSCDGPTPVGGFLIHTFDNHYHPNETMTEVLINSDNTGMIFVGRTLGFDNLYSYFQKYGFGQKTGVDLEEEDGSDLRDPKSYYEVDKATMTFGQGIAVNALQMVRGFCVLANGGLQVTPHIVQSIISGDKKIDLDWKTGPRIISKATSQTISQMLIRVANESPEHFPKDRIKELADFKIAAKSGTAQIPIAGKYASTGTVASVIGYFPAENPKYVVYVKLNEPAVRPWGSDTAGPVYFGIVRDLINYYGISPQ